MRNDDPFADLLRSLEESLQRNTLDEESDGGERPPRRPFNQGANQINPRRYLWIILLFLLVVLFGRSIGLIADWIWYDSVGALPVFITRYTAWSRMLLGGFLVAWLFVLANVILARRLEPAGLTDSPIEQLAETFSVRISQLVLWASTIVALLMGLNIAGHWQEWLLYLNQRDFGINDTLFNRDVSFYLFSLPIWQIARSWFTLLVLVTTIGVAAINGLFWRGWQIGRVAFIHLAALVALFLALIAWQYRLTAYELVYSQLGVVFGAGYTDANARLPAYNILFLLTLLAGLLVLFMGIARRGWRTMIVVLAAWLLVTLLTSSLYPGIVQRFRVRPNELNLERPYIATNIEFTRKAFDLDKIEVKDYQAQNRLTASAIVNQPETIHNIRLWDYRPLLDTYNQVQALTQYYQFNDVDIDRYLLDGEPQQVMLAARELVPEKLSQQAQTWVNRKLIYTHGYGVAMSPVSEKSTDGLPQFFLRDLPIQGRIPITQPQIYFGELTNDYVIAGTRQAEFDYPRDAGNVTTQFAADTGIRMSFLNRLFFALHFADLNMLLNGDINSESRLLWRRNIGERIREVAPFLRYDADPYMVIGEDGRLYWMLDAYTTSDRFPYSEPLDGINYIRNSVKVVMNAYDGNMTFYLMDEMEPIAYAYAKIYPALFKPFAQMPEFLKQHIRYPQGLFSVQAEVYRTYHMTNPDAFYNKEDLWAWPEEIFAGKLQRVEPYYVLIKLPGSETLDFVMIMPFTPASRENMIAWMGAQNDPAKYGQKVVFNFGKNSPSFGPKQVEARIDQDPEISAQLSLWNQQGSNVIRGNLLVLPIADSLLYVEPLYLQAENGKIPELKRVVLATADRVVMADNLGQALVKLLGNGVLADKRLAAQAAVRSDTADEGETKPSAQASTAPSTAPLDLSQSSLAQLVTLANEQYSRAVEAQRNGNWAEYGTQIGALQTTLQQMVQLTGVPAATLDLSNTVTIPATITDTVAPAVETSGVVTP